MSIRGRIAAYLLLTVTFGVTAAMGQASEDTSQVERIVEILNADSARATRVDGQAADMLTGRVSLRQGNTLLNAERAVRFKASDQIIFEGSVMIIDEGDSLLADRVVYESDVKTGVGTGNVRWSDGDVSITASLARYFVDDKVAEFEEDVVMQDSATIVLSLYGTYDVRDRVASFHDDVYLEQRRLALTAESLTHDRESGLSTATGRVWVFRMQGPNDDDGRSRTLLVADTARSERDSGMNHLSGGAGLVRIAFRESEADTLIVRSSSVAISFADSSETFDARENVRFWRGSLSGRADSLRYESPSDSTARFSTIRMVGSPYIWNEKAQVHADTIDVQTEEEGIRRLDGFENAFVGFLDDEHDFVQQLKGRRVEAHFASDSLTHLTLRPNAEALYFAVDSTESDKTSALRFTSSQIELRFARGEVDRITAHEDVEGEMTEIDDGSPLPSVVGFQWRVADRPARDDLLDPSMRGALERFQAY